MFATEVNVLYRDAVVVQSRGRVCGRDSDTDV